MHLALSNKPSHYICNNVRRVFLWLCEFEFLISLILLLLFLYLWKASIFRFPRRIKKCYALYTVLTLLHDNCTLRVSRTDSGLHQRLRTPFIMHDYSNRKLQRDDGECFHANPHDNSIFKDDVRYCIKKITTGNKSFLVLWKWKNTFECKTNKLKYKFHPSLFSFINILEA